MPALPVDDLDAVVQSLGDEWNQLRGATILVTGGTGFFGVWLVSALLHANQRLGLGLKVIAVARKAEQLLERVPELRGAAGLDFLSGDIRTLSPVRGHTISHVVHAATPSSAALNKSDPVEMANVAAEGTRRVLEVAREMQVARVLFTSSGAVYGRNPPAVTHVREEQMGILDPLELRNAYAEGKRLAELYCSAYVARHDLPVVIARCFAFVGPFLPLDTHFAIGNFMRDAMGGNKIIVQSDGSTRRSYLYASDLSSWLLRLLTNGVPGRPYNVGSEHDVSVGELAHLVGAQRGVGVEILGTPDPTRPVDAYAPSTDRIRTELGARELVSLDESVRRTMAWCEQTKRCGA
jgi:dTDP-glucose 4,6-dehydratase